MATQGLVSVRKEGEVVMKIVTGNDGYFAKKLAKAIKKIGIEDIDAVYNKALEIGFGFEGNMVVFTADEFRDGGYDESLPPLYLKTFSDPEFNPRWEYGTADHVVIIDL